jgi:hypothetical protein
MDEPMPAQNDAQSRRRAASGAHDRLSALAGAEAARIAADKETTPLERRVATLAGALRRARVENAEHSAALADLRAAEIARLELLGDALAPVLAQTPPDCDIFDVAVSPGARPRLFIDQIGFVEMDRDRRTYRFLQDTRHGRITLRESADLEELVEAVTNYIAHRLIEREKALAVDYASGGPARLVREAPPRAEWRGKAFRWFLYFIEFLGSAAFFGLLAILVMWAYRNYFAG